MENLNEHDITRNMLNTIRRKPMISKPMINENFNQNNDETTSVALAPPQRSGMEPNEASRAIPCTVRYSLSRQA